MCLNLMSPVVLKKKGCVTLSTSKCRGPCYDRYFFVISDTNEKRDWLIPCQPALSAPPRQGGVSALSAFHRQGGVSANAVLG